MGQTAKLFKNGRSQAVRLPAAFRFEGKEVFIRKDAATGDIILSQRPRDWTSFLASLELAEIPEGFLSAEERDQGDQDRIPFEGILESEVADFGDLLKRGQK